MNNDQKIIDKLFRDLVKVYSTSATSLIGLDAVENAITDLVCNDNNLAKEIGRLSSAIQNTQPRMFPLDNIMLLLDKEISNNKSLTKQAIQKLLGGFNKRLEKDMKNLVKNGCDQINNGDFIVIHSIEENIEHLIPEAKNQGKKFKILVLKQDIVTTGQILQILTENEIEFEVIPEYDLVH